MPGRLFGFSRMAHFKPAMRLFRKFTQAANGHGFGNWDRWLLTHIAVDGLRPDPDSAVMSHYGDQEGAVRGYNPIKPGRPSHHRLMVFVTNARMTARCGLDPGNSWSAGKVRGFLDSRLRSRTLSQACPSRKGPGLKLNLRLRGRTGRAPSARTPVCAASRRYDQKAPYRPDDLRAETSQPPGHRQDGPAYSYRPASCQGLGSSD